MDAHIKEYRDKAAEVRRIAADVAVPHIREALLKIAEQYEQLAASLERKEPGA